MELAQEKFNAVKELADISVAISESRGILATLKKEEEQYLRNREVQVHTRITRLLAESCDVLEKVNDNHQQLVSYKNDLYQFKDELLTFLNVILSLSENLSQTLAEVDVKMNQHFDDVNDVLKKQKVESAKISQEREQLKRDRLTTQEAMRALKDKEAQFLRSVEHINKLAK